MTNFLPGLGPLSPDYPAFLPPQISRMGGTLFFVVHENSRLGIATTIERLIDLLDACDRDPDLEEAGDREPSLGFPEGYKHASALARLAWGSDDCELDEADREDGGDAEPTLGACEDHPSIWGNTNLRGDVIGDQTWWGDSASRAKTDECEEENEHGGDVQDQPHGDPREDDEDGGDLEADPSEAGIADEDGLWQMGCNAEMTQVAL